MKKIIDFKNQMMVENHQLLSFSAFFAKIKVKKFESHNSEREKHNSKSHIVFFPGCSLMSLGEDAVMALYNILLQKHPDMSLSGFCCGKPSKHIWQGKKFKKRSAFIKENHDGIIYTACPNCFKTLGDEGLKVKSIWPGIDEYFPKEKLGIHAGKVMMIHDPCTARTSTEDHEAVRSIMNKLGIEVLEFENNRDKTICCGKINMTMALNAEKGMKILEKRASQCKCPDVVSYCASCVHSFGLANKNGIHVSELLISKKSKPSWVNRIRFVKNKLK